MRPAGAGGNRSTKASNTDWAALLRSGQNPLYTNEKLLQSTTAVEEPQY
jgi:hypothetical protein